MKLNKQRSSKCLSFVVVTMVLACWLYYWLQSTQAYSYFYREQQQIFLFDAAYISELVQQVGGVGALCTQFLVQFFVLPHMGALLSTLVSVTTAVLFWLILRKLYAGEAGMPLAFVPSILYQVYLSDSYAHYEGLVALCFMMLFMWLYTYLYRCSVVVRSIFSTLLALLLFFGFGAVAMLFVVSVVLLDGLIVRSFRWHSVFPLAAVLQVGLLANHQAWIVSPAYAFSMQDYVEYFFEPGQFYYLSWISVLVCMLVVWLLPKVHLSVVSNWVLAVVCLFALPMGSSAMSRQHKDMNMYEMQQLFHYVSVEDWDNVITLAQQHTDNYIFLNALNLAYAKKGELLNRLFAIPQQTSKALLMNNEQYSDVDMLMARLFYHVGQVSQAQVHAFSSNMNVGSGNPVMTQFIAKYYLIAGYYKVAEKTLSMLEKSLYYADWAREYRRFLYNDAAVEADPELGSKRKDLVGSNEFILLYGSLSDMLSVLDANPEEDSAAEYAIAMMLLDRSMDDVKLFVESAYGKIRIWPERLQEAILAYSEKDMEYCRQYGVSENMIQRFAQFSQETLALRHNGGSLSKLAGKWGNTFWYYMLKTTAKK